jgi:uncharacterized protein (TIGR00661 family)
LNWGLGHATRCVPIIEELLHQGATVSVAGEGQSLELLKQHFPQLTFYKLKGLKPKYSSTENMVFAMFKQIPSFLKSIWNEHQHLKGIIEKEKPDVVISDNRYGAWNIGTKNIFITHQLNIQMPEGFKWMRFIVKAVNSFFISRFDECWIPDLPAAPKLSGILSEEQKNGLPVRYLGWLSRFKYKSGKNEEAYPIVAMLSGPEPQRSILEGMIIEQLTGLNQKALVVRGKPDDEHSIRAHGKVHFKNHASPDDLLSSINSETIFIARSGYSTLMDLARLQNKAILIPTPGQTEQEYLADFWFKKKVFFVQQQNEFDISEALRQVGNFSALQWQEHNLLKKEIRNLLH